MRLAVTIEVFIPNVRGELGKAKWLREILRSPGSLRELKFIGS